MGINWRKVLPAGLLLLGTAVPVVLAVEASHQFACDRECLLGFTNSYLNAILAHNPSALQVAPDLKATENGSPVPLGEGLWKTAAAISSRQLFADESSGETGLSGEVTEQNGQRARLALRLSIDHRKIQEAETFVSPEGGAHP